MKVTIFINFAAFFLKNLSKMLLRKTPPSRGYIGNILIIPTKKLMYITNDSSGRRTPKIPLPALELRVDEIPTYGKFGFSG